MYNSEGLFQYGVLEKLEFKAILLLMVFSFLQFEKNNAFDKLSIGRKDYFLVLNLLSPKKYN